MTATYELILAPLDGSEQAAKSLPHAIELARGAGRRLILLRVIRPLELFTKEEASPPRFGQLSADVLAQQDYEKRKLEAERYLDGLAQQLGTEHISVERMVSEGTAATEILRTAKALSADLIVMTAHGFSAGLTAAPRGVFGSVCDGVLRNAELPVLVVR